MEHRNLARAIVLLVVRDTVRRNPFCALTVVRGTVLNID